MRSIRKVSTWTVCCFAACCFSSYCAAQQDSASLNMLLSPGAPGFVLLGVSPTSVERPGNVTDFAVDILNSTSNLSVLPQNYAIEAAPYWFFSHPGLSYQDYAGDNGVFATIQQTLSVSMATSSALDSGSNVISTGMGVGLRFSLLRGQIDNEFNGYHAKLDSVIEVSGKLNNVIDAEYRRRFRSDSTMTQLTAILAKAMNANDSGTAAIISAAIQARSEQLHAEVEAAVRAEYQSDLAMLKDLVRSIQLRRLGWKLDVAGGAVLNFPGQSFDSSSISRYGGWVNGGYELEDWSVLGVVRYLADTRNSAEDVLESGARLILTCSPRFSLSGEALYRGYPNDKSRTGWRADIEVDYSIGKNSVIAFTFGRDSQGRQTGTLISALNLLLGFGSERPQ